MRQKTYERIQKAWRNLPRDHEFESWEQFLEIAISLGEVSGEGKSAFYSRSDTSKPYGPENFQFNQIEIELDWNRVTYPAI